MNTPITRPTLLLAAGLALGGSSRADVLVVDAAGGGDFTDLPDAVAAAADGDTLLVKSGSYTAFELVDKGLHVVADVGASVHVDGSIRIEGLSTGKAVLLSGLEAVGSETVYLDEWNWLWATPAVGVFQCEGAVRVQDCDLTGGQGVYDLQYLGVDSWAGGGSGASVSDSRDVAFTSCQLRGGDADDLPQGYLEPWYGARGGHGLYVFSSDVTVNRCIAEAGDGGNAASGGFGGTGVRLASCELVATHSVFRGGDGGFGWYFEGDCGPAGHGVAATGTGTLRDLHSFFYGGEGGGNAPNPPCPDGVGIAPGVTRLPLSGAPRAFLVDRVVRDGEGFRAEYYGQPGDTVVLASAPATAYRFQPRLRGVWLLDRPWGRPLGGGLPGTSGMPGVHAPPVATGVEGVLGGIGTITVDHALAPLDPGVEDRVMWLQATMVDANGDPIVTNLQALVVVDDAF